MYKVKKGAGIEAISPDAPKDFKIIVFKHATQKQLEWLFKRNHPAVEQKGK